MPLFTKAEVPFSIVALDIEGSGILEKAFIEADAQGRQ